MEQPSRLSMRWIVGKRYDLFFFIGSFVFTFFFFGLYKFAQSYGFLIKGDSILITYFIFTAFFDHPHIFQTFSRTHLDGAEFKKHRLTHTLGIVILMILGFVVTGMGYEAELIVFASVFGSFHIIRQHYGFLRAYKGINGDSEEIDNWIDYGTFYTGMFACFFYDYTDITSPIVIYKSLQARFPNLPPDISEIMWSLFLGFLFVFLVRQVWRLVEGKTINIPKILLLSTALGTHYFIFFATATPFLVAEALETAYHDIQYQGWMMHYQKSRFPKAKNLIIKWIGFSLLYGLVVGMIEVYGLMQEGGWAMWLFVPFTMLVIYHYYVDGIVWRFSDYPDLRKAMFEKK